MNREAVALGTPVWTTFEGRLGAVDERLIADGRLRRLTRAEDVVLRAPRARRGAGAAHPPRPRGLHRPVREGRLGDGVFAPRRPNTLPRMRRRLRTAAFPIHRHALPQLALDAGLVALAYYLAYRLRFDGGIPDRYFDLFTRTLAFAVVGSLVCFTAVGMYRHWMRYSSQREYIKIAEGVVLGVLALVGYVAVVQPQLISTGAGFVSITIPTGVLVLFGLLTGAFLTGTRYLVHFVYERPLSGFRAPRNARTVLIVGAGDGGRLLLRELMKNPELGYRPVGFVDDDPRKQGMRVDRGLEVLGHDRRPAGGARGRRARRGADRDPVRPGHDARAGRQRLPRARRAGAHDADRLRAAADRRPADAPAARGARRGRAGPRPDPDGDRVRRRLPDRPLRARHRRGRLDRLRALPPDRPREPEPARPARQRRGEPVRDRARARRRAPRR